LTPDERAVLEALVEAPKPLPEGEVVRLSGLPAGAVRGELASLVSQGLAKRREAGYEGPETRVGNWSATDDGRAALSE
jgi:DNA-binding IclR family transcriptional regulator